MSTTTDDAIVLYNLSNTSSTDSTNDCHINNPSTECQLTRTDSTHYCRNSHEFRQDNTTTAVCPTCHRPMNNLPPNHFLELARIYQMYLNKKRKKSETAALEDISNKDEYSAIFERIDDGVEFAISHLANINPSLLNNGYYAKFFREIQLIGSGSFGSVYLCEHHLDDVVLGLYAVKKIPVGDNNDWLHKTVVEVKNLERLSHPNIVCYKHSWLEIHRNSEFCPFVPFLFMLTTYCDGGDLEAFIQDYSRETVLPVNFLELIILPIFLDICSGLNHLHMNGLIHRDLKVSNVLLQKPQTTSTKMSTSSAVDSRSVSHNNSNMENSNNNVLSISGQIRSPKAQSTNTTTTTSVNKPSNHTNRPTALVSDFGSCEYTQFQPPYSAHTGYTGTPEYCAPEVILNNHYSEFSDLWSLGIILFKLICGSTFPFIVPHDRNVEVIRSNILKTKSVTLSSSDVLASLQVEEEQSSKVLNLLVKCCESLLDFNCYKRPSCVQILSIFR